MISDMVYGTTPMPRLTWISAALVLLMGGFVWLMLEPRPARLAIAIGVLDHRRWGQGPSSAVRVGITNTGRAILRYNQMNFDGDASVRIESRSGWATRDNSPWSRVSLDARASETGLEHLCRHPAA